MRDMQLALKKMWGRRTSAAPVCAAAKGVMCAPQAPTGPTMQTPPLWRRVGGVRGSQLHDQCLRLGSPQPLAAQQGPSGGARSHIPLSRRCIGGIHGRELRDQCLRVGRPQPLAAEQGGGHQRGRRGARRGRVHPHAAVGAHLKGGGEGKGAGSVRARR